MAARRKSRPSRISTVVVEAWVCADAGKSVDEGGSNTLRILFSTTEIASASSES